MSYFRHNRLRIVEFNVENLFLYLDYYEGQDFSALTEKQWQKLTISTEPLKPLANVLHLARTIREMDPDIVMLCEVGGRESLANFCRYFLNDQYVPHLIEGNSDRGIDIGYITHRRLPFRYDLISHKHRTIDFLYPHEEMSKDTGYQFLRSAKVASHRFSRDVLELRLFEEGDAPEAILLLVHLKSQLDRSGIDPGGRDRRKAELEKLVTIYNEISEEFEGRAPILLGGDFNGYAALPDPSIEFRAIYEKTKLKDSLEWANVSRDERFTHMQIINKRVSYNRQIDYLFVPPELATRISKEETWVYRYKDEKGATMFLPRNINEKRALPSDHYPLILTLLPEEKS